MTNDKGILIRNIYHMLAYAFKELHHNNYEHIMGEDFENVCDLFAEILGKGIAYLLKQGLHKEYIAVSESLPTLRGKLNMTETIREKLSQRGRLACEYDELSVDNLFNQILKSAVMLLLRHADVRRERKAALRRLMLFFDGVDEIAPSAIRWGQLRYDRNSRSYQMLHSLCYFLLQGRLLTTEAGPTRLEQFSDDHMNLLFERFVLAYYKRHHPEFRACSKQIKWGLETSEGADMLPIMQSDITLDLGPRTLIIDTKYYSRPLREYFGKLTLYSPNLYQIHTYVMNEDVGHTGCVDGMLLYARVCNDAVPHFTGTTHDGNRIMVRSLDLNRDFEDIKRELEELVESVGIVK